MRMVYAPLTSGPLSDVICPTAPYRHRISSHMNCEMALALLALRALPSAAPDKSSRAATIYLGCRPILADTISEGRQVFHESVANKW